MSEKLYKVLVNGKSCHGGTLQWSLPKDGKPGDWHEVSGELSICQRGLHLTKAPYKTWCKWGMTVYEAEAEVITEWQDDKCVCRRARLLREVAPPKWWADAVAFVESINSVPFAKPDGKPLKGWKIFLSADLAAAGDAAWDAARDAAWAAAWAAARDAARDAAGDAAWDAARDAAWAAAGDAARAAAWAAAGDAAGAAARDAAWDAARDAAGAAAWAAARDAARAAARDAAGDAARASAWAAARDAARDAAGDAAWAAAWAAAGDAAWAAAWAAALYIRAVHICHGTKLEKRHIAHARKRWQVWKKGYCLLCDVNGVLYVYAKGKTK